ncbi:MAG TPA: class I mannose-6-phosphate isomerase [bacterium]|nr:class I mannose-6-phosphate isomerase [bacterium]HPN29723.1 class I mannose-6-phosphate isomerase [bacterium]
MPNFISYPIKFFPIFKENVWGGKNLKNILNKNLPKNKNIGESWEISTVKNNVSVISNGKYKSLPLLELVRKYPVELLGYKYKNHKEFPLLYKFLDASENLSVQTHPDNISSGNNKSLCGKSECWHIINTSNNKIILGVNEKFNLNKIKKLIKSNDFDSVLNYRKIKNGDTIYVPAGTVHAVLKGTLIAEIQQPSDITYRFFDWNRNLPERPLQIGQCLKSIKKTRFKNLTPAPKVILKNDNFEITRLLKNKLFNINLAVFQNECILENLKDSFRILSNISRDCKIRFSSGKKTYGFRKGETVLIPAAVSGNLILNSSGQTRILDIS